MSADPISTFNFLCYRSLAAAVFGDARLLATHTAAAMPLLPHVPGMQFVAMAHLLRGLSLAEEAKAAAPAERAVCLAELDGCRELAGGQGRRRTGELRPSRALARRGTGVGGRGLPAEPSGPSMAAMAEVARRRRPWHAALITERAARFHLAHGLERIGGALLAESQNLYREWGAIAKVDALEREFPGLAAQHAPGTSSRGSVTIDGSRTFGVGLESRQGLH